MSKIYMVIAGLTTAFVFVAFQNCSNDATFDIQDSQGIANVSDDGSVDGSGNDDGNTGDPVASGDLSATATTLGQILQLEGSCDSGGSSINVDGSHIANTSCELCDNGEYTVCTLVQQSGPSNVNVSQIGSESNSQVVTVPIDVTYPVNFTQYFHITSLIVNDASSGTVSVSCIPGSNISAKIYGSDVIVGGSQVCADDGTLTFDVRLVASLVNSGQRVLTVTQTTQAGFVTEVFSDFDNTDPAHTCSINDWSVNTQICDGKAGSLAGTCKGGTPVKVLVNGQLQQIISCDENNTFVAENLLLTNHNSSNAVTIEQYTPHGSACSASYSSF